MYNDRNNCPIQWRIQYFPEGGANPWGKNLLFDKTFAENCMKMKDIEPKGRECASLAPP